MHDARKTNSSRWRDAVLWNHPGWHALNWVLGFNCIMFLIRSVFRTVEFSQG